MINPREKKNRYRAGILFGIPFLILGLWLIWYSIDSNISYNKKNKYYVETSAKIVDYFEYSDSLGIKVEYNVDGKVYNKKLYTDEFSKNRLGSYIQLKYNPNNPNSVILDKGNDKVGYLIGIAFTIAGLYSVITDYKKLKSIKEIDGPEFIQQYNGLYNRNDIVNYVENGDSDEDL